MIEYIKIEGYKSMKSMELKLRPINVFIGSNGSGKSNFISFFKMVHAIYNKQLQRFVMEEKTDNLLYFGRKRTEELYGKMIFTEETNTNNAYWFQLAQTKEGGLFIETEAAGYMIDKYDDKTNYYFSHNLIESRVQKSEERAKGNRYEYLQNYLSNLQTYHFHDTSATSMLRRECDINDNDFLKTDGRNLPAFLYQFQQEHPKKYNRFVKTVQTVAPYIHEFILKPQKQANNDTEVALRWVDKGDLDSNFSAYHLSDGTLRFIALATVLMQPTPPAVIIIDEPELGLHPQAISKLAGLIEAASTKTQVIISTQSVNLVDCFKPEDIVTVDRSENQSIFHRLDSEHLANWLDEFSLGDLWQRNIINSAQPFTK
ncbi:ATP-binding cassette domain-containing protein [Marinilabiliaceae bacterium JC017]|nr:ATP-binding cassette domain-containing protein [Marinilabiliaceae bacterium JC017]